MELWSLNAGNVTKGGSDEQEAGSSVGEGGGVAVCNRSRRAHQCKG